MDETEWEVMGLLSSLAYLPLRETWLSIIRGSQPNVPRRSTAVRKN